MSATNRRHFLTLAAAAGTVHYRAGFADGWPKDKIIRAVVSFALGSKRVCNSR